MKPSLFKAIFAAMEQGIVFIDDQNRVAYCNHAAERIRNIRHEEILGRSVLEFHPRESHATVMDIIEDLRSGKVTGRHRMNIQISEGKFFPTVLRSRERFRRAGISRRDGREPGRPLKTACRQPRREGSPIVLNL